MTSSSIMTDWSQLPEELLHLISKNLEEDDDDCFDAIHVRSVCSSWRSTFPFPSSLLRQSYSLPAISQYPFNSKDFCTFEKVPLFLFIKIRVPATALRIEYFIGGISRDESDDDDHMEVSSPLQCSVKMKIRRSVPKIINILDCKIIPLGHQYRISGFKRKAYKDMAFLLLSKEIGGFVVLLNCSNFLLVFTSVEMMWKRLDDVPKSLCWSLVTFKGRFYANFNSRDIVVIDPYSLKVTHLLTTQEPFNYLVPSGNDELFLVKVFVPDFGIIDISRLTLRVSKLYEEDGTWVEVSDLGDRVLFINELGNFSCSAKELPHDCGVSGNSILITYGQEKLTFAYKYGVDTGNAEDDFNFWRYSRENCVTKLNTSFPVIAFWVER